MSLTRTNKILIAVVLAAAAAAAYWFLLLAPERERAAQLQTEIAAQQVELQQATALLSSYESARRSYRANYATLARLGKAVPTDDDVRSMLVQLDSAAKQSGVNFLKIETGAGASTATAADEPDESGLAAAPGAVELSQGFSAMPFSFAFDGSFFELSDFLTRVERFVTVSNDDIGVSGRLLRLESIEIEPAEAGFPLMQAKIGAASYLVPPPVAVGEAAAPAGEPAQAVTTPSTTTTATGATP